MVVYYIGGDNILLKQDGLNLTREDRELIRMFDKEPKTMIDIYDQIWLDDLKARRLYLYGEISLPSEPDLPTDVWPVDRLVNCILMYNREDYGKPVEERQPIMLYINSPGGDIYEGFALIGAIEASKTPVYTVNMGMCCSMAFLISIAGHKRYSLPYSVFLMHDGSTYYYDSSGKAQDKADFDRRFANEIMRRHVLNHGKMQYEEYRNLPSGGYYMLPEKALEYEFIDEIVTDLDQILGLPSADSEQMKLNGI